MLRPDAIYDDADDALQAGRITQEDFDQYAYGWRNGAYRFSATGKTEAARHARKRGLALPYTDRKPEGSK